MFTIFYIAMGIEEDYVYYILHCYGNGGVVGSI